jgi:hypothetical protein
MRVTEVPGTAQRYQLAEANKQILSVNSREIAANDYFQIGELLLQHLAIENWQF